MQRTRGHLVLALLMSLMLSPACTPTPTTPAPPAPTKEAVNPYERFLKEIAPKDWQEVTFQEVVDGGETPDKECAVFYRAGDPSENPIDAVMYRLSSEEPLTSSNKIPSFVAYDLYSPYGGHVCECECKAKRENLLSAYKGPELVIRDKCGEERTRLLAYRWVTDTLAYKLVAHFDGDRLQWEKDQVTVDHYTLGVAGLVFRCTYSPHEDAQQAADGTPLFNSSQEGTSSKCECIFPNGLPDDVLTSPYPEMIVLALYSQIQYTDTTKIQEYFADGAWASTGRCEVAQYGCAITSSPITHVRVISMEIAETRRVDPGSLPDQAIVIAKTVCEHEDGVEEHIPVTWLMLWEEDGWRLLERIPEESPP